jgi:hypothetical protein
MGGLSGTTGVVSLAFALMTASGCLEPSAPISPVTSTTTTTTSVTSGASPTPSTVPVGAIPGGPRAARIIFKQAFPSGSFDSPPVGGTPAQPGSGFAATRVFNADGSLLASGGTTAATWPAWLTLVEIGISGQFNQSATNQDCARFANTADANAQCDVGTTTSGSSVTNPVLTSCGAAAGLFRVSEADCLNGNTTLTGSGSGNDGVYIRATFSRNPSILGLSENILAVLEYASATVNAAPTNPITCFSGGIFDTTQPGCADQTWQIYIKHSAGEIVQPYLLFIPPSLGSVNTTTGTMGSGVSAKQFYIPLAGDQNLTTVQISRIKALKSNPIATTANPIPLTFDQICNPSGLSAGIDSAQCLGVVFYTLTFYRI